MATPLREKLDVMGVNRNYCIAGFFAVAGTVLFVVLTVLVSDGVCLDKAACPADAVSQESLTCNCEKFKWGMGGTLLGVAGLLVVYELYTGEGKKEMMATQAARTERLLSGGGE